MNKILVVEDSPTQAQSLALLLESEGFSVDLARDGNAGVAACKSTHVDVVLSDVVMPGIDGYELCRQIKTHPETSGVPVILLTSLADPMDIVRGLECGADNFIRKPYDASYLISRVRRLIENQAQRGSRKLTMGVDVLIMGRKFTVNSEKEQMLDLLISTFEEVLRSREREYETRLREETVRESHRFLQSTLDALSAQIAIVDSTGTVMAVNAPWRRFAAAFPWPESGVGQKYIALWEQAFASDLDDAQRILDGMGSVLDGQTAFFAADYPTRIAKAAGWFSVEVTRFNDRGAALVAIEQQDISARKQLEHQFQQSQKMEAIGQLAGGVAHDFNNLLTVIGGYAEMLIDVLPPDDARRSDVAEIIRAADTASALTRQLLAFSRRQVSQPRVLEINHVVADLDNMLRRLIGEDIAYATVLNHDVGRVFADPSQIQQILMNLAVNARDAMPKGGKLTIATANAFLDAAYAAAHAGVVPGRYVMLAVTDSGSGMDPETQERIFEPFFTTKGAGKGTGLGLSTVYGIVQQSNGHIWVYSELGLGTTFKVYLPRNDAQPAEEAKRGASGSVRPRSQTVLVVEDNDAVRVMLVRILRGAGYHVLEADEPGRAREICAQHPGINVLLSDVVMPNMNGIELVGELRKTRPEMRAVLMSGYSGAAMTSHGQLPADVAFLEKPFTPDSVLAKIRSVLD
jgi:two-component system, cell cycle sensor histidine kinase and response regulator CckA